MILRGVGARILADNVPLLYDFYTEILGFKVLWGHRDSPYVAFAEADKDTPAFAVFAKADMKHYESYIPLPSQERSDYTTYCLGFDDVDAAYEILKARGVPFMGEPRNVPGWEMRSVFFRDPEGNLFEIAGPVK